MSGPVVRSRLVPALGALALFGGGIYWQTAGGAQQPRSRAAHALQDQSAVSESLQALAGTGGGPASDHGGPAAADDPKNTRLYSNDMSAPSKKSAQKTTDQAVGSEEGRHPRAGKNVGPDKKP
ncbi:hypothetical protein P8C59_004450 [Phyllachora maydis]|uniref:Uncharacterized protein n=1 Tax=Phyllachora maydis TaxID=1825666 RepID=A0AAD9I439_9PEZI|nr:hypothetical protein P8C59_004450 [Phyllachora maydis]